MVDAANHFALRPLVLALSAALPVLAAQSARAQTAPRLPAVPSTALPKPAVGWLVNGKAGDSAYNVGGSATNPVGTVTQNIPRAIYQWDSFDVGVDSSMTFSFKTPDGAALNRVLGTASPSQILGRLSSTVAGANGSRVTGGTLLLINQNGILFGPKSQVNTGALIASTLNVGNDDFLSGFASTLDAALPTYTYEGGPSLYADPKAFNFVRVEQGAQISTADGGQVFLFAQTVDNAGAIRTPGGQTVLAGGTQVFLNSPINEKLYASELNVNTPATRGLLVEVNGALGRVGNTGSIEVPRGNASLVGMAVNQSGRISATTSVSENGSIFLLARSEVTAADAGFALFKRAAVGGVLTLGANSKLEITPDAMPDAKDAAATATATTPFTASRVELSGRQIELQSGASITAPGGIVNARAESAPVYVTRNSPDTFANGEFSLADSGARLTMAPGASINVAGTTAAQVSAARNFVTTELLGANDLKDAPLQRDGPLYRSRITFDLRKAVPILGDTSAYSASIARTAEEKMAVGGTVNLTAAGAVVLGAASKIDVSGGTLTYLSAQVQPSTFIASNGARFSPNDAPADIRYLGVVGNDKGQIDRWGRVTQFGATPTRLEPGYVEGKDAGSFKVNAPLALLGGVIQASAAMGERQQAGTDAAAKNGVLELGARLSSGSVYGSFLDASGVLRDVSVTAQTRAINTDLLRATSDAALPDSSFIAAATLSQSGAGAVRITSYGAVTVEDAANLNLPHKGSLEINAAGAGGVSLGGNITARGGSVLVRSADLASPSVPSGGVVLKAGQRIDVSGDFVNQSLDGVRVGSAVAGGAVQLASAHGLDLQDGSAIDVSGGATVNTSGSVAGTNAGSITLTSETGRTVASAEAAVARTHIGAALRGMSSAGGGSLTLRAAEIDIREQLALGPRPPIRDGLELGSLVVDDDLFRQGGFTNFAVEGARRLTVDPGVRIAPQASRWVIGATSRLAPSGSALASVLTESVLEEGQRNAASVALSSRGLVSRQNGGDLSLGAGALIQTDAGGNVSLVAGRSLVLDAASKVLAPGGKVNLELTRNLALDDTPDAPSFEIRSGVLIDASGKTVLQPPSNNLRQGRVFDGGSINLNVAGGSVKSARLAAIELAPTASLKADGASDVLDVSVRTNAGVVTRRTEVNSAGGAISIAASVGGARLAGGLSAKSGGGTASGGSFSLTGGARSYPQDVIPMLDSEGVAVFGQPLLFVPGSAVPIGVAAIAAQSINNGQFADVSLNSTERIDFNNNVTLNASRSVSLNTALLRANAGVNPSANTSANLRINAPGSVTVGALQASDALASQPALPPLRPVAANLLIDSGMVTFNGNTELLQFANLDVRATDSVRFAALGGTGVAKTGSLKTTGNVSFTAPQTTVTTATDFTVYALGKTVSFLGGDTTSASVPSAAGSLTVNAATIAQNGVVRVPFGRVTFNATEAVNLGANSLTSASGDGMTVPFGSALGTAGWQFDGRAIDAPAEKLIALNAPGQAVTAQAGSKLGLAGGGNLVALDFVAGPGGSKDVFTGSLDGSFAVLPGVRNFAPTDANIAQLASGAGAAAAVTGQQITLGAGSQLPADTYAVLPARYALLPGAFLITPSTNKAPVDAAYTVLRPDGAQVVAGQRGSAGTTIRDPLATAYVVRTSAQAQQLSEVRSQSADSYFAQRAEFAGNAVPRLPQDAGSLRVAANRLTLDGGIDFARAAALALGRAARGGEVDLAANRIVVADASAATASAAPGTLVLTPEQINKTGASSVVLGGYRTSADDSTGTSATDNARALTVTATEVLIANAAVAISVADLVVAATDRVTVSPRGSINASSQAAAAEALRTVGDGALLRVSADATATVTRTGAPLVKGELVLGAGAVLAAGGITAESTARTKIAADTSLQASAITLGAPRIALGTPGAASAAAGAPLLGNDTLLIGPGLASQFSSADALGLRSFSGVDVYGPATLGAPGLRALTLDTGAIAVWGNAAEFNVQAGGVRLVNTSGASVTSAAAPTANARMVVKATGNGNGSVNGGSGSGNGNGSGSGSGELGFGPGAVALQGVADVRFEARQAAVFENKTNLQTSGNLTIAAPRVGVQGAADATATAAGLLRVESFNNPAVAVVAQSFNSGASLALKGARVEQAGTIALPSGRLEITATGTGNGTGTGTGTSTSTSTSTGTGIGNSGSGVEFASGSKTLLAGRSSFFDSVEVTTPGGDLKVDAGVGNIVIGNGVIDVSASGAQARAGRMEFVAKTGSVEIGGSLLARSVAQVNTVGALGANSALGGKLSIDSASAVNLTNLATTLNREADATNDNFASSLVLRNRVGNQALSAGSVLSASTLDVSADAGSIVVAGTLNASGAQGGSINLAARDNLAVAAGAQLLAVAQDARGNGGQVRLNSRDGRISVGDATVDTTAVGASLTDKLVPARNGNLSLSATRVGAAAATAAGTEVQLDLLRGNYKGVGRIDVEAVKVYNYAGNVTVGGTAPSSATALPTATIAAHNASFAGTNGAQADTILSRLAGTASNNADLRGLLHLRSGVEIRSAGDIVVTGDSANSGWNLTPFAANGTVSRPGGEAMNLTLRAAGNLNVQASISDGFRAGGSTAPTTAAAASRILPESTIVAGVGSALQLVGGADLAAASRLATVASDTKGDVVIGRAGSGTSTDVIVRTTTGKLDIAAGRDVKLLNGQAVAYTTGAPIAVSDLTGWVRPVSTANRYAVVSGSTVQSTMLNGSGTVTVSAARDVVGANAALPQYGSNWWWRGESASDTLVVSWWSRYDKFKQGFGSLSGGDVIVNAGRDAVDVQAAAGSSGFIVPAKNLAKTDVGATPPEPSVNRFGAGGVNISALRDVLGGVAIATGPRVDVAAGSSVKAGSTVGGLNSNLQVLYGNSAVSVVSRRDLTVGRVTSQALLAPTRQFNLNTNDSFRLGGLSQQASLRAVATSGALNYAGTGPFEQTVPVPSADDSVPSANDNSARVIPSRALFASLEGASFVAKAGGLIQLPAQTASLSVLAKDSLDLGIVTVAGISNAASVPGRVSSSAITDTVDSLFLGLKSTQPQADGATAVRFISSQGNVNFGNDVKSSAALRVKAGQDVRFVSGRVQSQHENDAAVSLIEAGRDIRFANNGAISGFTLHGPGDLVALAGRDVDLGASSGFQTTGNRVNSALPPQSANLTLVAGVGAADWRAAQSTYFHVLGGTGVAGKQGDVVAQLDATANGQSVPGANSAAAKAFDALTVSQRVDGARQRVGDVAFDAAVLSLMRATSKQGQALTLAQARAEFDKQTDAVKLALVGKTLAIAWAEKVALPAQKLLVTELVTAVEKGVEKAVEKTAANPAPAEPQVAAYGAALRAYVKRRTGTEAANLGDAIDRFAALPLEQQLLFTDQVLTAEVRAAGRTAAALSGSARDTAYAKAYDAIDAVFPSYASNAALAGNVRMGSSQVKTLQGSNVAILTPRGGVNVGELATTGATAADLGIVTTSGGDVALIVRDNVDVNQSRVFTVGKGDLLMWSGQGNIDAGRGAKTVTGAPPPVYRLVAGKFEVDTSGSFSGSGIAVLNADSTLDLYAPKGEINAGDAGIKSLGNAFLGASRFVGADNLAISGAAVGAPPPVPSGGVTAALSTLSQSGALNDTKVNADDSEEEKERKRRRRLALVLDFLGFGEAPAKP